MATIGVKAAKGHVGMLFVVVFNLTVSACLFLILRRALQLRFSRISFKQEVRVLLSATVTASIFILVPLRFVRDGWRLHSPTASQLASPDLYSSIARYVAYSNAVYVVASGGVFAVALFLLLLDAADGTARKSRYSE